MSIGNDCEVSASLDPARENLLQGILPLDGVTVMDLTRYLPGQLCTSLLADYGARVIRIENPRDIVKISSAFGAEAENTRLTRAADSFLRNKESLIVDLGHENAEVVLEPLIQAADIFVQDFRPGTLHKLGLGYEAVSSINPRVNYCSMSFAGETGPYRDRPGHDQVALALTGLLARAGHDPDEPTFPNLPVADVSCGLQAALGILLAQMVTDKTGVGQHIEASILEALAPYMAWVQSRTVAGVRIPGRATPRLDVNLWRTKDGLYLCLTNMEPKFWQRFCASIGRNDLAVRQFDSEHYAQLKQEIQDIFLTRTCGEWLSHFSLNDVQAAQVQGHTDALRDSHLRERGIIKKHSQHGFQLDLFSHGIQLSKTPAKFGQPGEEAGASTLQVLDYFGIPRQTIRSLLDSGCIKGI